MGGDLLTLLKEEPVLSEDSVRGFGQDLALALQHAHANGLVTFTFLHQGCKAHSVMLKLQPTRTVYFCIMIWGCVCCVCSRLLRPALFLRCLLFIL